MAAPKTVMRAFRIDELSLAEMEKVRDRDLFPTQSDFVRAAIRRLIRDERHRQIREQIRRGMAETQMASDSEDISPAIEDWFARLERADRGDL